MKEVTETLKREEWKSVVCNRNSTCKGPGAQCRKL